MSDIITCINTTVLLTDFLTDFFQKHLKNRTEPKLLSGLKAILLKSCHWGGNFPKKAHILYLNGTY